MQVDLFNIDTVVKLNKLKEVTNPILLERGSIPTSDGLLSYDIFGRVVEDRMTTFGYIDLHGHFLHPLVFKCWKRIDRKIEAIVSGNLYVRIDGSGTIVEDENGWTGLEALYENFDKIKFKKKDSHVQQERIDFLNSLDKDEVFCSKWLIEPAYYRDLQLDKVNSGKVSVHEITTLYSQIMRLTTALAKDFSGLKIVNNSTRNKIQSLLLSCFSDNFMKEIKGKNGIFRKFVMGKSVDYGCRLVITAPMFNVSRKEDLMVDFEHVGLPLASTCVCFFPFIIKWIKDYFYKEVFMNKEKYPVRRKDGTVEYVKLTNVEKYNDEYFDKAINSFIKSYADRFATIPLENDKGYNIKMRIVGQYASLDNHPEISTDSTIMSRPLTWTDLLYMAAVAVTQDKHVVVTR